jgi:hypothetical protein
VYLSSYYIYTYTDVAKVGSLIAIILVFWYTIAPRSVQTAQAATLTDNPISFALQTPAYADISD